MIGFVGDSYVPENWKVYSDINSINSSLDGSYFFTDETKSAVIFFPAVGFRGHQNALLLSNNAGTGIIAEPQGAYWLSAAYTDSKQGHGVGMYNLRTPPTMAPLAAGSGAREYTVRPMAN